MCQCGRSCPQNSCKVPCKRSCRNVFEAILSPQQEVTFTQSYACGYIKAVLSFNVLVISGYFEKLRGKYNLTIGSRIQIGYAGRNGDVIFALNPSVCPDLKSGHFNPSMNTFNLSDDQVRLLKDRQLYVNIYTDVFPGGELRGQLLPRSPRYFIVNLSGLNEVPLVNTTGTGILLGELKNSNLTISGSIQGLGSSMVLTVSPTINIGSNGMNGPPVFVITVIPDLIPNTAGVVPASRNVFALTCSQEDALFANMLYVNVITMNQPSGEIRGQFFPLK